jgi:hypothetical protein
MVKVADGPRTMLIITERTWRLLNISQGCRIWLIIICRHWKTWPISWRVLKDQYWSWTTGRLFSPCFDQLAPLLSVVCVLRCVFLTATGTEIRKYWKIGKCMNLSISKYKWNFNWKQTLVDFNLFHYIFLYFQSHPIIVTDLVNCNWSINSINTMNGGTVSKQFLW